MRKKLAYSLPPFLFFGQLSASDRITPYLHDKHRLYDLFPGSRAERSQISSLYS
ncbi:MAG: hypothetical protein KME12_21445 [Trichocoleus desertorum ATA4-8-CV12]|nr:hypothetical protein [Trichocoleus desertorum ATA4-8-CV12]